MLLRNRENVPGGEIWHIAGNQEVTNNELAETILRLCGQPETNIRHIDDFNIRPGHDRRYALTCEKMSKMGWHPMVGLEEGLRKCVDWYSDHPSWLG